MSKKEFYGIDLGTTYSCIAKINSDDIIEVITNPKTGMPTTPSAVSFLDDGTCVVGQTAKNNLNGNYDDTVVFIKREMSNDKYTRTIKGNVYDQVDISSFILKELVNFANQQRQDEEEKEPIYDVVITVPAYFGTKESERTLDAGKKAGLNVLRLIHEPTAATLSYAKKIKANKTLLVYDLGGGTFDVSIVRLENGSVKVLATGGDHLLGGADWDRKIIDYALDKINESFENLNNNQKGLMITQSEQTKKDLTSQPSAIMSFNIKGQQNVSITREEFESMTEPLMDRTMDLVDSTIELAVKDGHISSIKDIDDVLLVGGSCMMPMVKTWVAKKFDKEPKLTDPHMAVAKGAALTAAITSDPQQQVGGLKLGNDKGSRAYGMLAYDNKNGNPYIYTLIKRNDDLVVHREYYGDNGFSTKDDNQTGLGFRFFEYDLDEDILPVDDSLELKGKKNEISWATPVPKGTPIRLVVDRDKNGSVTVFAECQGSRGTFEIVTAGGKGFSFH